MTTLLYDRSVKTIAVDSKNTNTSAETFLCTKIELLRDGRFFLGSGHLLTIGKTKRWAEQNFSESARPEYGEMFTDPDEYGFSCMIISADGSKVTVVDDEMEPWVAEDVIVCAGSGGGYARAARLAGASMERSIEIAIMCDSNSGGPVRLHTID